MKILTVSDTEVSFLYSPLILQRFSDTDMIISCGDLPYYYLEYILSMLNVPLYYVRGNHASKVEDTTGGIRTFPWGAIDLHRCCKRDQSGMLLAGIEGSINYNNGPHQYTQTEMWLMAFELVPQLMINRLRFGRYLDILVTHSPPWKIHDGTDRPHVGIKAFRWLVDVFKPLYHLHGHIHIYRQDTIIETMVGDTTVLNTYGYHCLNLHSPFFSGFR